MSKMKILTLSFNVINIKFQDDVSIGGQITANVRFLNYKDQRLFEPVFPSSNPLYLYTGGSFTFGINGHTKSELCKEFIVYINLYQTDPEKMLSESVVDVTNALRDVFCNDPTPGDSPKQVKTTVRFNDHKGELIATLDITIVIAPPTTNLINDLPIDVDINNQFINTTIDCHTCPKVSDLKCPDDNEHSDDGEWDMMSAKLKNGHSIAIKYKRKYYSFQPTEPDEHCEVEEDSITKSEEKLNSHILNLLSDMHNLILENPKYQN